MVWFFNNPAKEDSVKRAMGALKAMGYDKKVKVLKHDPTIPSEAAGQLGIETGAVVQSLPYMIGGQPIIAFIAGDHKCKPIELPRCLNLKGSAEPMTEDGVKQATGFAMRGVAPVAVTGTDILMAIDVSLKRFDTIYVPAGHPQCYFGTTVKELNRMTQGIISYAIAEPA
ncbi:MAG: YbaK/EbsC family protein [Rhodospirillaceae bacterium]|jgi:prolyl-tRNA editing enzyme YbaK/EbsC (Cys-tRNA(Pro) deacylase)